MQLCTHFNRMSFAMSFVMLQTIFSKSLLFNFANQTVNCKFVNVEYTCNWYLTITNGWLVNKVTWSDCVDHFLKQKLLEHNLKKINKNVKEKLEWFFLDVFFKLLFILCNEILKSKVIRSLITWLFKIFWGVGVGGSYLVTYHKELYKWLWFILKYIVEVKVWSLRQNSKLLLVLIATISI